MLALGTGDVHALLEALAAGGPGEEAGEVEALVAAAQLSGGLAQLRAVLEGREQLPQEQATAVLAAVGSLLARHLSERERGRSGHRIVLSALRDQKS